MTVIRLVCRGTIEEEILQHAQMKLRLEKDITNTGSQASTLAQSCLSYGVLCFVYIIYSDCSAADDMVTLLKQGLGLTSSDIA